MIYLNPRVHGYIDYLAIVFLFIAPSLFRFSGNPASVFYVMGIAYLVLALLTAYPGGLVKMVAFNTHGVLELLGGIFLLVSPWLFRFADERGVLAIYLLTGTVVFVVWLFTDYRATEREHLQLGA